MTTINTVTIRIKIRIGRSFVGDPIECVASPPLAFVNRPTGRHLFPVRHERVFLVSTIVRQERGSYHRCKALSSVIVLLEST